MMKADIDPFLSIYSHIMLPLLHGFIYKYLQRFYGALFLAISKAGVMIPPLCVNLQILRTLELPVCLFVPRLIDQFTKIYDPPFGSIYRELWWPICHNLQRFFNPLVVLQIEDLRPGFHTAAVNFYAADNFSFWQDNLASIRSKLKQSLF